jgi:hypothetical protein
MFRTTSLLLAAVGFCAVISQPAIADDSSISGSYKSNGQEAKLTCVSAYKKNDEGKVRYVITFSEKDHSKEKKPDFKATFGHFGSALVVIVTPEGKIVSNNIAHSANKKGSFTALGDLAMSDFKIEGGKIQGKLSTSGEQDAFGEKWEVKDLKFQTKAP